jgi:hypothetical protein
MEVGYPVTCGEAACTFAQERRAGTRDFGITECKTSYALELDDRLLFAGARFYKS